MNNTGKDSDSEGDMKHLIQLLDEQEYDDVDSQLKEDELMMISKLRRPFIYKHPQETFACQCKQMNTASNEQIENEDLSNSSLNISLEEDNALVTHEKAQRSLNVFIMDKTSELTIVADFSLRRMRFERKE